MKDRDLRCAAATLLAAASDVIATYGQHADVFTDRKLYGVITRLREASVSARMALREPKPAKAGKR